MLQNIKLLKEMLLLFLLILGDHTITYHKLNQKSEFLFTKWNTYFISGADEFYPKKSGKAWSYLNKIQ